VSRGALIGECFRSFLLSAALLIPLSTSFPQPSDAPLSRALQKAVDLARTPFDPSVCQGRHTLCALFLGHGRAVDPTTRASFQSSGLAHLLALSGGQTAPLAAAAAMGASALSLTLIGSSALLRFRASAARIRALVQACSALGAAFLFGATGALLRLPCVSLPLAFAREARHRPLARAAGIVVVSSALGNAFADASFVLSCLGAEALFLATRVARTLLPGDSPRDVFVRGIGVVALASVLAALALAPWTTEPTSLSSLFVTASANLLAVPWATFVVTPAAALALVAPHPIILNALDSALDGFAFLAAAFASDAQQRGVNVSPPTGLFAFLRSPNGPALVAGAACAIWAARDVLAGSRTRALQSEFRALTKGVGRRTPLH
jgi:hypothetical protein